MGLKIPGGPETSQKDKFSVGIAYRMSLTRRKADMGGKARKDGGRNSDEQDKLSEAASEIFTIACIIWSSGSWES